MSTYVYKQSNHCRGELIGKVESGYVYDLRRGRTEYSGEVIARISNDYVYPAETIGYGVPQFYCSGNIVYKGSYSSNNIMYCAEGGYIYIYPKSNNHIVAQYTGYATEALLCFAALQYYKKSSTASSDSASGYNSISGSSSQSSSGGAGGVGCSVIIGLPIVFILLYPLVFFNDHPEWFCFVYVIPPVICLLFALGKFLFSEREFKSNGFRAIGGFILGAAICFGWFVIITLIESFFASVSRSSSVLLGNQVLSESVKFIIGMVSAGIAGAILMQFEDK